jgi:hypothetical protein
MLLIFRRFIFLTLFLIIGILFTLGFAYFPIMNIVNIFFTADIYTDKLIIKPIINGIPGVKEILTTVNDEYKKYVQYLFIACIVASSLIGGGILFSISYFKSFSKLLFIFAQLFMLTFSGIIIVLCYTKVIDNAIPFPELPDIDLNKEVEKYLPDGIQIPSDIKIPDDIDLPDGVQLPDGVELPDGVSIPTIPKIKIQDVIPLEYKSLTKYVGTGGMLIILSTILMIINYIVYSFYG